MRVSVLRLLRSSISSFGRQRSRAAGERRNWRIFMGSIFVAGVLRAERRGALLDSVGD